MGTRFGSQAFAKVVAEVLANAGIPVALASEDYTTTPALSYAVRERKAAGGVMITSSHNPAAPENGGEVQGELRRLWPPVDHDVDRSRAGCSENRTSRRGCVIAADFKTPYVAAVTKFVDLEAIRKAGFKFAVDAMYGSGRGVLKQIFAENGIEHIEIRGELNPLFPGINPEPNSAACCVVAGDRGSRALPGRNGYRW